MFFMQYYVYDISFTPTSLEKWVAFEYVVIMITMCNFMG